MKALLLKKRKLTIAMFLLFVFPSCSSHLTSSYTSSSDNSFQFDTLMNPGGEERYVYEYSSDEIVERKVSYYQPLIFNDKDIKFDSNKLIVQFDFDDVKCQILSNTLLFDYPAIIFRVVGKTNSLTLSATYDDFTLSKTYQVVDRSIPSLAYYKENLYIPSGHAYLTSYEEYQDIVTNYPEIESTMPSWLKNKDNYVESSYLIYTYKFNNTLPQVENLFFLDTGYLILNLNVNIMNYTIDPDFSGLSSYIIKLKKDVAFSKIGIFNSHNFSEITNF